MQRNPIFMFLNKLDVTCLLRFTKQGDPYKRETLLQNTIAPCVTFKNHMATYMYATHVTNI